MKYFVLLVSAATLLTSYTLSVSAQVRAKTLQLPVKEVKQSTNNRKNTIRHTYEAETAELMGGSSKVADIASSGGSLVSVSKSGQSIRFSNLQAGKSWPFVMHRWRLVQSVLQLTTN